MVGVQLNQGKGRIRMGKRLDSKQKVMPYCFSKNITVPSSPGGLPQQTFCLSKRLELKHPNPSGQPDTRPRKSQWVSSSVCMFWWTMVPDGQAKNHFNYYTVHTVFIQFIFNLTWSHTVSSTCFLWWKIIPIASATIERELFAHSCANIKPEPFQWVAITRVTHIFILHTYMYYNVNEIQKSATKT